jgi:uncharacterized lipoprotein (TIGR02269 family)
MRLWVLLLAVLVTACASTDVTRQRWEAAEECDDPEADRCTVLLCGVEACALYSCEDVDPGGIVRAQAVAPVRPPAAPTARPFATPANRQRYWGSMQGLPDNAEPIFIIPWNESSEAYAARLKKEMEDSPKRTWVKHHVFPQAMKEWFTDRGVNIHEWTLVLDKQIHEKIHYGANGGPWNAAWRRFIEDNTVAPLQAISSPCR